MARFRYQKKDGEFAQAMAAMKDPVAFAGTAAITEAGDIAKRDGRADIAAAGFSKRWQNALRVNVYPRRQYSIDAAALIFHNIRYAGVFEEGAVISGKPRLWLPLKDTPKRAGRQKMTPALYVKTIGPLVSIERPGKPPLLAGRIATSRRSKPGQDGRHKVSLAALRRGGAGAPSTLVPLFIGIDRVSIKDRFSIRQITERAAARLGELYLKNLRVS
ncbi:hypothetical protein EN851_07840 [Mesorhizobium sp. M8A.F.Ca.ET.208.01.1.1]|uniref:DUF6441 family protein n=1 Tax=unclassified Mesorhizobium TaxID=325217 RepID=UPI00109387BB|nr:MULTISPECIES: DUF6441 family protein [unclassified Mesorhizobium]TGQ95420.1 hypothetical protein EN851_07840 [Mesorhizobium sp. M8A.F.Ca.ET.208.01.1.1]TGT55911.1 hypothetical protein EN810_07840 [Mesorhizobium sp. M8A.F.Ca.ET.167.01.1.1]